MQDIRKEDVPLPTLGPKLEAIRDEVVLGKGFHLLRCGFHQHGKRKDVIQRPRGIHRLFYLRRGCADGAPRNRALEMGGCLHTFTVSQYLA
jgi:hypothetical protein